MSIKNLHNYLGLSAEIGKARNFWKWFLKHQDAYLFINEVETPEKERLLQSLGQALHSYHPDLVFEIGGHSQNPKMELLLSAEGCLENFPAVELLAETAPELENWKVVAFKRPLADSFSLEIKGRTFRPEEVIFLPLVSNRNPQDIAIRICYEDYSEAEQSLFILATYRLLESLLGERAVATELKHIEVRSMPDNLNELESWPLSQLPEYLRNRGGHTSLGHVQP